MDSSKSNIIDKDLFSDRHEKGLQVSHSSKSENVKDNKDLKLNIETR